MGKGATGPITYLAQAKGFKCVKVRLKSFYLYQRELTKGQLNTAGLSGIDEEKERNRRV